MSRYFVQHKHRATSADPDGWNPLLPSLTVDDHVPVDTGLVDQRGDAIMRAPNPVGFHRVEGVRE